MYSAADLMLASRVFLTRMKPIDRSVLMIPCFPAGRPTEADASRLTPRPQFATPTSAVVVRVYTAERTLDGASPDGHTSFYTEMVKGELPAFKRERNATLLA